MGNPKKNGSVDVGELRDNIYPRSAEHVREREREKKNVSVTFYSNHCAEYDSSLLICARETCSLYGELERSPQRSIPRTHRSSLVHVTHPLDFPHQRDNLTKTRRKKDTDAGLSECSELIRHARRDFLKGVASRA
jgi:hypothetical protein